jgi:hypothetical protein
MAARSRSASHGQAKNVKSKAVWSSPGRRYRAKHSASNSHTSPTNIAPYSSATARQKR